MVGKKSSLGILKTLLKQYGVHPDNIVITSLLQGLTYRWVLAWTFSRPAVVLYKAYAMLFVPTSTTVFKQNKVCMDHTHTSISACVMCMVGMYVSLAMLFCMCMVWAHTPSKLPRRDYVSVVL
ncbi:DUF890 domain-containing protein [archaeon]|nr:MAG: DUF890 domain-containing protein [archaeon]